MKGRHQPLFNRLRRLTPRSEADQRRRSNLLKVHLGQAFFRLSNLSRVLTRLQWLSGFKAYRYPRLELLARPTTSQLQIRRCRLAQPFALGHRRAHKFHARF